MIRALVPQVMALAVAAALFGCDDAYDPAVQVRWLDGMGNENPLDEALPYADGGTVRLRIWGCAPAELTSTGVLVRDIVQLADAGGVASWTSVAVMNDDDSQCTNAATPNRLVANMTIQHAPGGMFEVEIGAFGTVVRKTIAFSGGPSPTEPLLIVAEAGNPTTYRAEGAVVTVSFMVTRGGAPATGAQVVFTSTLPTPPTPSAVAVDMMGHASTSVYAPSDIAEVLIRATSGAASDIAPIVRAAP